MPGMITVSQQETFSTPPLVMSALPKLKFGSADQDITANGERKWLVQVAVSYFPDFGRRAVAEVIEVGLTGEDPGATVQPGMPVQFDRLRAGATAPELTESGRVRGGRLYWQADAVRPLAAGTATAARSQLVPRLSSHVPSGPLLAVPVAPVALVAGTVSYSHIAASAADRAQPWPTLRCCRWRSTA